MEERKQLAAAAFLLRNLPARGISQIPAPFGLRVAAKQADGNVRPFRIE